MPFKTKVKKMFGKSDGADGSSLKTTKTADSNTYAAGDVLPTPKYRGKIDPEHKAALDNFTFADENDRRRSAQSLYSPHGSRMPSRNNSTTAVEPRKFFGLGARGKSQVGKVMEADDTDASNVGGSRHHSYEAQPRQPSEPTDAGSTEPYQTPAEGQRPDGFAHDHKPFTEADVNLAITNSRRSDS